MKVINALATLIMLLSTPAQADDVRFIDLTPNKYSGKEENLAGFAMDQMELRMVDPLLSKDQAIRWRVLVKRQAKAKRSYVKVKGFTIHFEIRDRKGSLLFTETGKYRANTYKGAVGVVATVGDAHFLLLSKRMEAPYPEISYWVSDIEWMEEKYEEPESDRVVFPLK